MDDLKIRYSPARMAHVVGHHPKALGLELAPALTDPGVLATIEVRREDQAVAMQIGAHEKDRSADSVQLDGFSAAAEGIQMQAPLITPAVLIEGRPPVVENTMRLDNIPPGRHQLL